MLCRCYLRLCIGGFDLSAWCLKRFEPLRLYSVYRLDSGLADGELGLTNSRLDNGS